MALVIDIPGGGFTLKDGRFHFGLCHEAQLPSRSNVSGKWRETGWFKTVGAFLVLIDIVGGDADTFFPPHLM